MKEGASRRARRKPPETVGIYLVVPANDDD